jgi:7-carboxy-7-deazaguanine synthase
MIKYKNIKINEMFSAIQGEGFFTGLPVYFIRTSGCNTKCDFCDTQYHNEGTYKSIIDVVNTIRKSDIKDIVFTGGEPTLHINQINNIMKYLPIHTFHLETNGSLYNPLVEDFDIISVSPKKQLQDKIESYKNYNNLPQTFFKFVYENSNDLWWEDFNKRIGISNRKTFIMPQGATTKEQLKLMPEVMEYCLKNKFQFSPRLHTLAYGNKRGV